MPRYSIRKLLYTAAVLAVVFGVFAVASRLYREFWFGIDDAYAKWGAAEMIVDYMRDHEGEWPRDWDSLAPYFAQSHGRCGGWSFSQYRERIWIDFEVDVQKLLSRAEKSKLADYKVIRAYNSESAFGAGPNQDVHDYLRRSLGLATTDKLDAGIAAPVPSAVTQQ